MSEISEPTCALVTGASSGLGAEFARQLAPRLGQLVLVARREDRLAELATELRKNFPDLIVTIFAVDLSVSLERENLAKNLTQIGCHPDLLINNAGLGDYGDFALSNWEKLNQMLQVNVTALTHLSHLLVPAMIRRGGGAIANVSSLASLIPIPDFAVYAATKAYVTSFSEALRIELREHRIPVLAVCPGPVRTEFGEVARRGENSREMPSKKMLYVSKEQVVAEALAALDRGNARVYPGLQIAAAAVLLSAIPLVLLRFVMGFRPRRSR